MVPSQLRRQREAVTDMKNAFEERERALEAGYFSRKDAELVERLKLVFHKAVDRQSIRDATGVTDEELLDRLVDLNLDGELMAAFNLLPVIEVAWADGVVDDREVRAVHTAAAEHGIQRGSKAYAMLETRLREGPATDARKLWFYYAEALQRTLSPQQLEEFRKDLLDACWRVAESSG